MVWSYVAWYTAGRTWIEMLRIDDAEMITLFGTTQRLNVWTSLLLFLIAIGFLIGLWATRPRTAEARAAADSVWLPGREQAAVEEAGEDAGEDAQPATEPAPETEPTPAGHKVNADETQNEGFSRRNDA
jgi:hypothetical protein